MKRKTSEQRREERVRTLLPVKAQGETGIARDVSASAIFFETDAEYAIGSPVNLALDLETPWGKVMLRCAGKIVRVEQRDDTVGVAVQFAHAQEANTLTPDPSSSPAQLKGHGDIAAES